jgi:hypothetical protein
LVGVVLLVAAFAGQHEAAAQRRTPSAVSWEQRAAPASDNSALRRQIAE